MKKSSINMGWIVGIGAAVIGIFLLSKKSSATPVVSPPYTQPDWGTVPAINAKYKVGDIIGYASTRLQILSVTSQQVVTGKSGGSYLVKFLSDGPNVGKTSYLDIATADTLYTEVS